MNSKIVSWKQIAVIVAIIALVSSCLVGANEVLNNKVSQAKSEVLKIVDLKIDLLQVNLELILVKNKIQPITIEQLERRKKDGKQEDQRKADQGSETEAEGPH